MPRTPDRFPGERQDEGLVLLDNAAAGDPSTSGGLRFITDRFRFRDDLGLYTGRPAYESTSAPTATDDNSAGYNVGMTWTDTTTGVAYICRDDTDTAAIWEPLNTLDRASKPGFTVGSTESRLIASGTVFDNENEEYVILDGGELVQV